MTSTFRLRIDGEDIDTSTALTAADVQKLVRKRLLAQAEEHRRHADNLAAAVEAAARRMREAGNTAGTLRPDLAEELDKPWDPAAFARSPVGRYADARRVREAERAALFTLGNRRDKRAKHAGGGWGCGFDTIEYEQAKAEHGRLAGTHGGHIAAADALGKRASSFRVAAPHRGFSPIDLHKEARALKRAAQPSKTAFAPGSWVRWDDPQAGRTRFGVVTSDPAAYDGPPPKVPPRTAVRYIVPADGRDALVMAPHGGAASGAWRCQRPEWGAPAEVLPALAQDGLFAVHALTPAAVTTAAAPEQAAA